MRGTATRGIACCAAALLLCGCASGGRGGDDGDGTGADTASVAADGILGATTLNGSRTAVARVENNESYTLYSLELAFAGEGGELSLRLEQTGSQLDAGDFVRYMSAKSLVAARWARSGEARTLSDTASGDPSVATLSALEWKPGGHVAGTADLRLWRAGGDGGQAAQRVTARFDVHLTAGP